MALICSSHFLKDSLSKYFFLIFDLCHLISSSHFHWRLIVKILFLLLIRVTSSTVKKIQLLIKLFLWQAMRNRMNVIRWNGTINNLKQLIFTSYTSLERYELVSLQKYSWDSSNPFFVKVSFFLCVGKSCRRKIAILLWAYAQPMHTNQ